MHVYESNAAVCKKFQLLARKQWAAYGMSVRIPSGSPAVYAAKAAGDFPNPQAAHDNLPIQVSVSQRVWAVRAGRGQTRRAAMTALAKNPERVEHDNQSLSARELRDGNESTGPQAKKAGQQYRREAHCKGEPHNGDESRVAG
jgi:hypothetical protein